MTSSIAKVFFLWKTFGWFGLTWKYLRSIGRLNKTETSTIAGGVVVVVVVWWWWWWWWWTVDVGRWTLLLLLLLLLL